MQNLLTIPVNREVGYWNQTMMENLIESNMFEVRQELFPEPKISQIIGKRHKLMSFFKINNRLMALDVWDAAHPTSLLTEFFKNDPYYSKTEYIFKIQHRDSHTHPQISQLIDETGIKVRNWSMFKTAVFPLGYFKWENKPHKYLAAITGKRRTKVFDALKDHDNIFKPTEGVKAENSEYLELLKNCRWGFSLKGKRLEHMDCKNRREVEFSSCGMPLVLNYVPEYPFPFKPNVHYVLAEEPEDILKLTDIDPIPYHEAAIETYQNYFTPEGISRILLNIINEG